MNIPIEDIKVKDKKFMFSGGKLDGEQSSDGKPLEVEITPTIYAGTRDNTNSDDYGEEINLLGIPVGIDEDKFFECMRNRELTEKVLNNVREKTIERATIQNAR